MLLVAQKYDFNISLTCCRSSDSRTSSKSPTRIEVGFGQKLDVDLTNTMSGMRFIRRTDFISTTIKLDVVKYIKCTNSYRLYFVPNPRPVILFSTHERGFRAIQTQKGLNESPWKMFLRRGVGTPRWAHRQIRMQPSMTVAKKFTNFGSMQYESRRSITQKGGA